MVIKFYTFINKHSRVCLIHYVVSEYLIKTKTKVVKIGFSMNFLKDGMIPSFHKITLYLSW